MKLKCDLTCWFGLGKSLAARETSTLKAGTIILDRFDKGGVHKFTVTEYGRTATYAVANRKILDDAVEEA